MPTVNETLNHPKPPIGAQLAAGVETLSGNQTLTFTLYKKMVLPLDGFVFWINNSLLTLAQGDPTPTTTINCSIHYTTETEQEEASTISKNTFVVTALEPCDFFQGIDTQWLYLANYEGIRFSFNSQGKFYKQADLWHYIGVAVTSIMNPQIIDTQEQLDALQLVVSNSLPVWLGMPSYVPPYPGFTCSIPLYPSFLVPDNEPPPYGSVHIEDTVALTQQAMLGPTLSSSQLSQETVRVTLYGVNNDEAVTFLNFVLQYSYDWEYIGLANMPIILDEKLTQSEIMVISQKKSITFRINYVQNTVRDVARQFIKNAKVKYIPSSSGILPRKKVA